MPNHPLTPPAALSDETRARLITAALAAQRNAYVPYSHYPVGAALLTADGHIFAGCNVENASFGGTICYQITLADLLPRSFGPQQLGEGVARNDHGTS